MEHIVIHQRKKESVIFKALENKSYCKRHIDYQKNNEISEYCCGISYSKKAHVTLYKEKIELLEYLDYRSVGKEKNDRLNVTLAVDLEDKFFVPTTYSLQSKLDWFAGYCDADGSIAKNGLNQSLQISCIHKDFLMKIKFMLQTCGIASKVTINMKERLSLLPNGNGSKNYYKSKQLWRILIGSNDLQKLINLGFSPKRLLINKHNPQRNATQYVKIKEIIDNNRIDKTYCFNEPKRHAGIFNGVITSQCTEIIEYSNENETAVCNLASIGLPMFVKQGVFDFNGLKKVTRIITHNLNKVIDLNFYPTEKTKRSNMFHRPIGIGIQGLSDVFALMNYNFDSLDARQLNKDIFETIYFAALTESNSIAVKRATKMNELRKLYNEGKWNFSTEENYKREYSIYAIDDEEIYIKKVLDDIKPIRIEFEKLSNETMGAYSSFEGSPASKGLLQFDLWDVTPSDRYDWTALKQSIQQWGLRNSLLISPMPTASTSQILGNNECFEPFTSNIYVRRTIAGDFIIINKHLMKELCDLKLWNVETKNLIVSNNGSIQNISYIPNALKEKYRTVWEIPMKSIIEMSRDRGAYICQSQSLNLWMKEPTYDKLTAMHFFSWSQGLKTGIYYLRTKAKAAPQQFTVDPSTQNIVETTSNDVEDEGCLMCSG